MVSYLASIGALGEQLASLAAEVREVNSSWDENAIDYGETEQRLVSVMEDAIVWQDNVVQLNAPSVLAASHQDMLAASTRAAVAATTIVEGPAQFRHRGTAERRRGRLRGGGLGFPLGGAASQHDDRLLTAAITVNVEIRDIVPDRLAALRRTVALAFGQDPDPAEEERDRRLLEFDRNRGAFDGNRLVGAAGAYSLDLTIPGGRRPPPGSAM